MSARAAAALVGTWVLAAPWLAPALPEVLHLLGLVAISVAVAAAFAPGARWLNVGVGVAVAAFAATARPFGVLAFGTVLAGVALVAFGAMRRLHPRRLVRVR